MLSTTTLLQLEALLSQEIGDHLEFDSSTNLSTASTAKVIATTLAGYDMGQADYFNDWFLHVTEGNNTGKVRRVKDYLSTSQTLKLWGSAWAAEVAAVTLRLHRFNRTNKVRAINRAIEQLYPALFKEVDDLTLIGGNYLPDASFEWWTSSSALKLYTAANVTMAKTSTSANTRGQLGTFSAKATASAAINTYFSINSNAYPKLLDLMGRRVSLYAWAYPQTANDAGLYIITKQADGTTQTLASITQSPAGEFTLIAIESQQLNDDLVEVEVRFNTNTNGQYVYWDDAWFGDGGSLREYLLPAPLQSGTLAQVFRQTTSYSDLPAYDLHPKWWRSEEFNVVSDGTYRYLSFVDVPPARIRFRLKGFTPLETLSADTDTISLDGPKLNLIVAYAAHLLYEMEKGTPSSEDKTRYERESAYWMAKTRLLQPTLTMMRPTATLR